MRIFLLGSFEIQLDGLALHSLKSDKNEALLGYMAIMPNRLHRRSVLSGLLWPNHSEMEARHSLSQAIYTLRSLLAAGLDQPLFHIQRQTVEWTGRDIWVDCCVFDQQLQACKTHLHADPLACPECLKTLEEAVRLYRGEFWSQFGLDDCNAFEDWLQLMRENYRQKAVWAMDQLVKGWIACGDVARALDFASRQTALDPYNEAGRLQYMHLLSESGRRPEAIASYEVYQRLLASDLSTQPGDEIHQFYQKILHAQHALPTRTATNLPGSLVPLVGRQTELQQLFDWLCVDHCRLVTILGLGGAGKTHLAFEAGSRLLRVFPDGVWVVRANALESPDSLLLAIAGALGVNAYMPSGIMATGRSIKEKILGYLCNQRLLLIIDGCEHIPEVSSQVAEILHAAPFLKVLTTSLRPIDLEGETLLHLEGLAYPPEPVPVMEMEAFGAVRLYLQTVQRMAPRFSLTKANSTAVVEICRMVQGMPLGILLAAACGDVLEPERIAEEIRRNLDFLASQAHGLPDRQRSLRATLDYSWKLLSESERQACRRLSVFPGSFTPAFAEQVCQATVHDLKVLFSQSLLQRPEGRFFMHDMVRRYASEQLDTRPSESFATHQRHSRVYLGAAESWSGRLQSREQLTMLAEIDRELANLQVAWNWAAENHDPELEKGIDGFSRYFLYKGRIKEGLAACQRALQMLDGQAAGGLARRSEIKLKTWICRFLMLQERGEEGQRILAPVVQSLLEEDQQDPAWQRLAAAACLALARVQVNSAAALELAGRGLDLYNAVGQKQELLSAQNDLASIYASIGDTRATYRIAQEALDGAADDGDPYIRCQLSIHLLFDYLLFGEDAAALRILRDITAYYQQIAGPFAEVELHAIQATTYFWVGQLEAAQALLEQNIANQKKMEWLVNQDFEELLLCQILAANKDYDRAIDRCSRLVKRSEIFAPNCLALQATIYLAMGKAQEASGCLEACLAVIARLRRDFWAWPESLAGLLACWQGDWVKARQYILLALEHSLTYPVYIICATTLGCLALILAEVGRVEEGAALFGQVCAHPFTRKWGPLRDLVGSRLPSAYEQPQADVTPEKIFQLAQNYLERIRSEPGLLAEPAR